MWTFKLRLQWGSEYWTGLVLVVRLLNALLFKCHYNIYLNLVRFNTKHLNTGQVKVHYSDVCYSDHTVLIFFNSNVF